VLIHLRARRRLGAYLDGALEEAPARALAAHLAACPRCRREVEELRRLRVLLRAAAPTPPPPDWTGFWAGVARGIEAGRRPAPRPAWRRWLGPRRVALSGALAAAALITLTLWQVFDSATPPEAAVVVRSARTDLPGGVMVYASPERDLAVVWVFDSD
jgi:anti-sigma factor RsiW